MELKKQVCSLELAKKLKELGVKQESLFYWYKNHAGWQLRFKNNHQSLEEEYGHFWEDNQYYSAYTVAELGEMLPTQYVSGRYGKTWDCWRDGGTDLLVEKSDENEANARAKMLIYLIENNLLTL